jgi:hypothetical protein
MCEFCENIAKDDEQFGIIRMKQEVSDFIFANGSNFGIYVDTGDSFCRGF